MKIPRFNAHKQIAEHFFIAFLLYFFDYTMNQSEAAKEMMFVIGTAVKVVTDRAEEEAKTLIEKKHICWKCKKNFSPLEVWFSNVVILL